jgi:nucleoside-diphosphate-sugar epimerase
MVDSNKVLIVGFGYLGQALATALLDLGYQVWAMRRTPLTVNQDTRIQFFQGDASRSGDLVGLPHDFGQIVCAVAPDERSELAYRKAYPLLMDVLLSRFPLARLLLVSSTAVYEQSGGLEVPDCAPAEANSATGSQIRIAEQLLLDRGKRPDERPDASEYQTHVVVRASGIYGPGRIRLLSSLFHHELPTDEGEVWTSRIHRDDLVAILAHLLERRDLFGVFNASDPSPSQLKSLATWVKRECKADGLPLSEAPVRSRKSRRIVPARLVGSGYVFRFPSFVEGYRQVLQDWRAH